MAGSFLIWDVSSLKRVFSEKGSRNVILILDESSRRPALFAGIRIHTTCPAWILPKGCLWHSLRPALAGLVQNDMTQKFLYTYSN